MASWMVSERHQAGLMGVTLTTLAPCSQADLHRHAGDGDWPLFGNTVSCRRGRPAADRSGAGGDGGRDHGRTPGDVVRRATLVQLCRRASHVWPLSVAAEAVVAGDELVDGVRAGRAGTRRRVAVVGVLDLPSGPSR